MSRFSLLQIDVEVEEPETSENPTQSFEIQLLAVIIYSTWISMYNMILFSVNVMQYLSIDHHMRFPVIQVYHLLFMITIHCYTTIDKGLDS